MARTALPVTGSASGNTLSQLSLWSPYICNVCFKVYKNGHQLGGHRKAHRPRNPAAGGPVRRSRKKAAAAPKAQVHPVLRPPFIRCQIPAGLARVPAKKPRGPPAGQVEMPWIGQRAPLPAVFVPAAAPAGVKGKSLTKWPAYGSGSSAPAVEAAPVLVAPVTVAGVDEEEVVEPGKPKLCLELTLWCGEL